MSKKITVSEETLSRPRSQPKFDHITDAVRRSFLETFARCGVVAETARLTAIPWRNHYNWLDTDPDYKKAFEVANDLAADMLETEATRRAMKGSDLLLIFLLKARRPHIFREQRVLTGDPANPVKHEMRITVVRSDSQPQHHDTPAALGPGEDSD